MTNLIKLLSSGRKVRHKSWDDEEYIQLKKESPGNYRLRSQSDNYKENAHLCNIIEFLASGGWELSSDKTEWELAERTDSSRIFKDILNEK